jgi:O-antigen/teichoic acid export membrane protein
MSQRSLQPLFSLSWQSFAYGIGIMGRQVVIYLTLPLFTNFMPQTEYGVVAVFVSMLGLVNTLTNAGLQAATFRFYNDTFDEQTRRYTISSSLLLFFLFASFLSFIILLAAESFSPPPLGSADYVPTIRILAVLLVFETLIYFGYILLRLQIRPYATSLHNIVLIVAQVGLALLFVRVYNWGATGYFLGYLGGDFIGLGVMIWLVRDMLVFQVSAKRLKELMIYGLPIIPADLSMWALRLADRSLIASIVGLDQVAVYEIGYKIGLIVGLAFMPFNAAWPPFAFATMHKPNAPEIYRNVLTYIASGYTFLALGVIAFRSDLTKFLVPPSYAHAVSVVPWVAVSQIFLGLYPVLSLGPKIKKQTGPLAWVAFSAAIANILLNILLIPWIGILGAAIATLVGYLLLAVIGYSVGQRYFPIPLDWVRLGKLALASGLTIIVIIAVGRLPLSDWEGRILRALSLLIYPLLLIAVRFITPTQARETWQMISNRLYKQFGAELTTRFP